MMGARWLWFAVCVNGHEYSNFSGGADACYECEAPPAIEVICPHWALELEEPCDCEEVAKECFGEEVNEEVTTT